MTSVDAGNDVIRLPSLTSVNRVFIRSSLGLFTGVVLLLLQSAFWTNHVSAWMQAIIATMALVAYFRPHYGLLALAALAPLGQAGSRALGSQMRGAEALVLAFLAGALLRGWTLRGFRNFPSTRLEIAALIFGFIVAASCAEQLWFLQIQRDFPLAFAWETLTYASRNYFIGFGGFSMVFSAMLLLEGMALLVYAARYARQDPRFAERLIVMIVVGAVTAALLTIGHVAAELYATGQAQARFSEFFASQRWSVHVGDVNAAGSFFAMGMFIALGMALMAGRHLSPWIATAVVLGAALWLTHSRTTIAAVLVIFACLVTSTTIGRMIGVGRTAALTAAAVIGAAVGAWHYLGPEYFGTGAQIAVTIRWLFLGTTWRMLLAQPVFGVGIGQYSLWSHYFAPAALLASYPRENAHNNFAQIAGELGLAGFVTFVAVLVIALSRRGAERRPAMILMPVLLGLSAFILSWLGGHPLLVPEVSYPFWITLGIAAALIATDTAGRALTAAVGATALLLVVLIPFRVDDKSAQLDFSRVNYGVSAKQLMTSRARFFVPSTESQVEMPLRARGASNDEPVEIEVFVDGLPSETITLDDRNWRKSRIRLPAGSSHRFRQIDLRIKPTDLDNADSGPPSVEVGNWEIISKPNG